MERLILKALGPNSYRYPSDASHLTFSVGRNTMVEEQISSLSQDIRSSIAEDSSVPRNVRSNVVTGLETYLLNRKDDLDLRVYSTISVLEEQINDANIPQHARTRLFEFIRDLEGIVLKWEKTAE